MWMLTLDSEKEVAYWRQLEGQATHLFEIHKEKVIEYDVAKKRNCLRLYELCPPFWLVTVPCLPCICYEHYYFESSITARVNAQHLALGPEHIFYRMDAHEDRSLEARGISACLCPHREEIVRTIPLKEVRDVSTALVYLLHQERLPCDEELPAPPPTLTVKTEKSGAVPELTIAGVVNIQGFRDTLFAFQQGTQPPEPGLGTIVVPEVAMATHASADAGAMATEKGLAVAPATTAAASAPTAPVALSSAAGC